MDGSYQVGRPERDYLQDTKITDCDCGLLKKIATVAFFILAGTVIGALIATKAITLPCAIVLFIAGASSGLIQLVALRVALVGALLGGTFGGIAACKEQKHLQI